MGTEISVRYYFMNHNVQNKVWSAYICRTLCKISVISNGPRSSRSAIRCSKSFLIAVITEVQMYRSSWANVRTATIISTSCSYDPRAFLLTREAYNIVDFVYNIQNIIQCCYLSVVCDKFHLIAALPLF